MDHSKNQIVRSTCNHCFSGCGVLIHMKDGIPVKVEGDPDHPASKGALCIKGKASLEILNHPDRLKYPMKRAGKRGEGKWQRISWDEALLKISDELLKVKDKYGPEAVAFLRGAGKGYQDRYMARFANVFGSPNLVSTSNICFMPRFFASLATYGYMANPDYEYPTSCIILWASNCEEANIAQHQRMEKSLSQGAKLIVIDPVESVYTRKADIWAKPRPSSDLALALGLINIIIEEDLYDKDFVNRWTKGFDKLREHIQEYTPEKVSQLTWVPSETIREIAHTYAISSSACIEWGNGLDTNINAYQSGRALSILRAITGNLGIPGGEIEWTEASAILPASNELNRHDAIPMEVRKKRIGGEENILPIYFSGLPQKLIKAILTSEPYPIRAAYIPGAAVLQSYNNAQQTYEALMSLDFIAVADFFMIPTAELADIVLPVSTYMERDGLHQCPVIPVVSIMQKVAQVGECWSDAKIFNELAKKIGLGDYFWNNEEESLDFLMKPSGLTFDEFRNIGILPVVRQYRKYERDGFNTPSKKVELYSEQLAEWGFDAMPIYREPPETMVSDPELSKEFPLILLNRKMSPYAHSAGRQIDSLRKSHPDPQLRINIETAASLNISEGDWVYVETKRGRARHKATLSNEIERRVVLAEHSWWFPEKDNMDHHGWEESNLNMLTNADPPYGEVGSLTLRGFLCRVSKEV